MANRSPRLRAVWVRVADSSGQSHLEERWTEATDRQRTRGLQTARAA